MTGCHGATHREQQEQARQDWDRLRADFKISLASQQFEQGHIEDAVVTLQEAIALDATTPNHHLLLAKCYLEQGSLASAQQATVAAANLGGVSAELAYTYGMIAEQRLHYEDAVTYYRQAAGLDPQNVDYLVAAAEAMVSADRIDEAKAFLDDGLQALKGNEHLHLLRARVCMLLNEPKQAAADYGAAEPLLADTVLATGEYGLVLVRLGRYAKAISILQPMVEAASQSAGGWTVETSPSSFVVRALAQACNGVGASGRAKEILQKHLQFTPDDSRARWLLADSLIRLDDWDEARRCVQLGERTTPEESRWRLLRAYIAWHQDHIAEAITVLESLLADHPNDVFIRCFLARLYREDGQLERADAQFGTAHSIDPSHPWVRSHFNEPLRITKDTPTNGLN